MRDLEIICLIQQQLLKKFNRTLNQNLNERSRPKNLALYSKVFVVCSLAHEVIVWTHFASYNSTLNEVLSDREDPR